MTLVFFHILGDRILYTIHLTPRDVRAEGRLEGVLELFLNLVFPDAKSSSQMVMQIRETFRKVNSQW